MMNGSSMKLGSLWPESMKLASICKSSARSMRQRRYCQSSPSDMPRLSLARRCTCSPVVNAGAQAGSVSTVIGICPAGQSSVTVTPASMLVTVQSSSSSRVRRFGGQAKVDASSSGCCSTPHWS
jgi:hypothetical protein